MCLNGSLKVPTLDIFHSASLLLEKGFRASIVDSVLLDHSKEECVSAVSDKNPTMVAIRTASGSFLHDLEVAEALKSKFNGPIVFYGPQVAREPDRILESSGVDALVFGEATLTFLSICRKESFDGVPGVWFKENGLITQNLQTSWIEDLDVLPIPRWDLVPYKKYSYVVTQTSWGCPFGCGYCPYPVTQGSRWRTRSIDHVVNEFKVLRNQYGLRFVLLLDPEFTLDRKRTVDLCEELIKRHTPIMWGCETRLDTLDEDLITLMAKAGCIRISFGVDTVNPETLHLMHRKEIPLETIRERVTCIKKNGIVTYAFYMIGLPGETEQSTMDMIQFALDLKTDVASFFMATPFYGTQLEQWAHEHLISYDNGLIHLTSCVPSMQNEHMDIQEIHRLYTLARTKWRQFKAKESRSLEEEGVLHLETSS